MDECPYPNFGSVIKIQCIAQRELKKWNKCGPNTEAFSASVVDSFPLGHIHAMYITSPLKFMDEIFESLPNLFVVQMIKKWMNAHIQILDQL